MDTYSCITEFTYSKILVYYSVNAHACIIYTEILVYYSVDACACIIYTEVLAYCNVLPTLKFLFITMWMPVSVLSMLKFLFITMYYLHTHPCYYRFKKDSCQFLAIECAEILVFRLEPD